mmetsp:Transcript_20913/g.47922  ORF Transcript_20913/g.47922 Transcript_20913/m.47922 type:complete len:1441 (-) Transcript_20913:534-4856(-)
MEPQNVAVVGGGIAGLASALLLHKNGKRVTIFEAEDRCGGHALTVDTDEFGPVDVGFQVCNLTTYPHLMGLFKSLGIETVKSDMSFSLSTPSLEWGSRSLDSIFCEPGSVRSLSFLRMLREVVKFGGQAPEVLTDAQFASMTLGEYLQFRRYSKFFKDHYVVPMCAAIWSCSNDDALAFPVVNLVHFWKNHHLLDVLQRPVWRVLKYRSKAYVDAVVAELPDVRTSARVISVHRVPKGGVSVRTDNSKKAEHFDAVVMATHSDTTLQLLGESLTDLERNCLSAIKYQQNEVYLHTDSALMPRKRKAWASWNCIQSNPCADDDKDSVCVSYWVNLLQNLPTDARDLFVTLNPRTPPDSAKVLQKFTLAHPLLNTSAMAAQAKLVGELQGVDGVYFAGAWCSYGFHEDGIRSAVEVVKKMCHKSDVTPWKPISCNPKMSNASQVFLRLFLRFGEAMVPQMCAVRLILPNGDEAIVGARDAAPSDSATIHIYDASFFGKVVRRSDIGFGESYMDGDFAPQDLHNLLDILCRQSCGDEAKKATYSSLGVVGALLHRAYERLELAAHKRNANTVEGSARNISYHYDAGNDFYQLFLDKTMLYSSGIHPGLYKGIDKLSFEEKEDALEAAQYAKMDAIIERAQLKSTDHVLEIGCGWGAFAIRMAQTTGCRVTGITVSKEQLKEASARVENLGLSHLVELKFCDYRKVEGTFDKVVSIEMLEAVGHENLPVFFEVVSRALKPGGIAAIQVITLPDERYEAYCNSHSDFIRTYIFPGGHLPSLGTMVSISSKLGLELDGCRDLGEDYAVTLRLWRERMLARAAKIRALGYSDRFIRMYEFYFVYCEVGFANHLIHDYQISWRKVRSLPPLVSSTSLSSNDFSDVSKPADPITSLLLALWCGLILIMIGAKIHMAIIPASLVGYYLLHALLRAVLPHLGAPTASTVNALLAAAFTASGSSLLAGYAVYLGDLRSFADLTSALVAPAMPSTYLLMARLTVGASAGFSALRVWECVHEKNFNRLEAATYTVNLICATSALNYDKWLFALAFGQLCEAHTAVLRFRSLAIQSSSQPLTVVWICSWILYFSLRLLPHLLLVHVFGQLAISNSSSASIILPMIGLMQIILSDGILAWSMLRAQQADLRTAAISAGTESRPITAPPNATRTSSIPFSLPCAVGSVLVASVSLFATLQQELDCYYLIGWATCGYGVMYAILKMTNALQPKRGVLSPVLAAEWRSRLLSIANACILIVGSFLCFSEWPYYQGNEAFISDHNWSYPVTFAALFVAYLQWDLCWCVYHHHVSRDVGALIHHSLFIAISHYVLWGWYFKKPFAWLSLTELSTPFLNLRWMLAVRDRKDTKAYKLTSFAFAITFLATRTIGYALGLIDLWRLRALWLPAKVGLYYVIAGVHAGFALNLFWSTTVASNLLKALRGVGTARLDDSKVNSKSA